MSGRPSVSVVVPFAGDEESASRLRASLAGLELAAGDEVIVADNSRVPVFGAGAGVAAVVADGERTSYHARNAGAARAQGEWILFTDSDCVPDAGILDAYFRPLPRGDSGALAGSVVTDPAQGAFLARYAEDRGFLDQDEGMHTAGAAAATANLMVRRAAFEAVGGFTEGIRSAGDVDLCRRLAAAGWALERRPDAVVRHLHRESLADLLRTIARYAAGARWLNERYPGSAPSWPLGHGLASCGRDIAAELARGRFQRAAFRAVDALGMVAHSIGYRRSNAVG